MHEKFQHHLLCPDCRIPLSLDVFSREGSWVVDGLCSCPEGVHHFPVIGGVPRIVSPDVLATVVPREDICGFLRRHGQRLPSAFLSRLPDPVVASRTPLWQAATANLYSYMWRRCDRDFERHTQAEYLRLTGGQLDFASCRGASVVDLAAGLGRYSVPVLEAGAREVVCVDLGDAICLASEKFRNDDRVLCVQADIYHLPLRAGFDLVQCIGVLQHLPDPCGGFVRAAALARPGGRLFVWCYGESTIKRLLLGLRALCKGMPPWMLWGVAAVPTTLRFAAAVVVEALRTLGLRSLAERLPAPMYAGYSFSYLHVNTFDHLSAKIINFFKRSDLDSWIRAAGLQHVTIIERFPNTATASWVIDAAIPETVTSDGLAGR